MSNYKAELGKTKQRIRELRDELESEESQLQRLVEKAAAEKYKEKEQELDSQIGGLNLLPIRNALCENFSADEINLSGAEIALHGSGPWDSEEFHDFLLEKEFTPCTTDEEHRILVLGKGDIDDDTLTEEIAWAIEEQIPLEVFTQELFVYYMINRTNPLTEWDEDLLFEVVEDHYGLQFVISYDGFIWPSVETGNNDGIIEFDSNELRDQSVLHKLGYNATEGRLSTDERRRFLSRAYSESIDHLCADSKEKRIWGSPDSQQRLYAMARLLSKLISFRSTAVPNAAERWRSDLAWLKDRYYRGNMRFQWPCLKAKQGERMPPSSKSNMVRKADAEDSAETRVSSIWSFPTSTL